MFVLRDMPSLHIFEIEFYTLDSDVKLENVFFWELFFKVVNCSDFDQVWLIEIICD